MNQLALVGCPSCKAKTPMLHLHDTIYGIPETHMVGSERFECSICRHVLSSEEADGRGLVYTLDTGDRE